MRKILLIIQREYFSRIKKKSFIIMTILGPLLLATLFIVPIWLSQQQIEDQKTIGIIDDTKMFYMDIPDSKVYDFELLPSTSYEKAKEIYKNDSKYYAILYIPENLIEGGRKIVLCSYKQPSRHLQMHIKNALENSVKLLELKTSNISEDTYLSIENLSLSIATEFWDDSAQKDENSYDTKMILGYFLSVLIYMFIFMYSSQVMRGVIEEKTSRIVEVLVSSVKPFQLMMGKIVGIAMVGITQFLLWVLLTFSIVSVFHYSNPEYFKDNNQMMIDNSSKISQVSTDNTLIKENPLEENPDLYEVLLGFNNINYGLLIGVFLFYFIGGFLLYGALFASIGAAVDSETDTQQFMLPVTIPMIFSLVMVSTILNNPDGTLAKWLSIFPLTSPVSMMVRVPFFQSENTEYFQIISSMILLILGFLFTTWLAAKIYKTGILMYGKKVNYKELWKWLKY